MDEHAIIKSLVENLCNATGTKKKYWAGKCGFTEKDFSRILNGRKILIPPDIRKICNGLNISPNDIIKLDQPA